MSENYNQKKGTSPNFAGSNSWAMENLNRVDVYKTSVEDVEQRDILLEILQQHFPSCRISVDLHDCDKVLRIASSGQAPTFTFLRVLMRSLNISIEELSWYVKHKSSFYGKPDKCPFATTGLWNWRSPTPSGNLLKLHLKLNSKGFRLTAPRPLKHSITIMLCATPRIWVCFGSRCFTYR